jgi:hypothetical protein
MSPHPDPIVEEVAQRRFKLESLLEEQSTVIRRQPGGFQKEYERNSHGFASKPGDQWVPVDAADKERLTKVMEEMCAKVPTCIDE